MTNSRDCSPEVILLAGAPWSGKSTLAERAIALGAPQRIRHISVGNLKRSIIAGETPSRFARILQDGRNDERKIGASLGEFGTGIQDQAIPRTAIMTGILEEFILADPTALTVVDGFPRYQNGIEPFKASMSSIGANVLGLCIVALPLETLKERSLLRPTRAHQDQAFAGEAYIDQRLADHYRNVVPTLGILATEYPTRVIDGLLPVDEKASQLLALYERYTANPIIRQYDTQP